MQVWVRALTPYRGEEILSYKWKLEEQVHLSLARIRLKAAPKIYQRVNGRNGKRLFHWMTLLAQEQNNVNK